MPHDAKRGYKYDGPAQTCSAYIEVAVWEQLSALARVHGRNTSEMLNEIIKNALGIPTRFGVTFREDQ